MKGSKPVREPSCLVGDHSARQWGQQWRGDPWWSDALTQMAVWESSLRSRASPCPSIILLEVEAKDLLVQHIGLVHVASCPDTHCYTFPLPYYSKEREGLSESLGAVGCANPSSPLHLSSQLATGWGLLPPALWGLLVPGSCQGRVGVTYGARTSCTLLMICLPTMMTRSSCASSMRQPPAAHCSIRTPG